MTNVLSDIEEVLNSFQRDYENVFSNSEIMKYGITFVEYIEDQGRLLARDAYEEFSPDDKEIFLSFLIEKYDVLNEVFETRNVDQSFNVQIFYQNGLINIIPYKEKGIIKGLSGYLFSSIVTASFSGDVSKDRVFEQFLNGILNVSNEKGVNFESLIGIENRYSREEEDEFFKKLYSGSNVVFYGTELFGVKGESFFIDSRTGQELDELSNIHYNYKFENSLEGFTEINFESRPKLLPVVEEKINNIAQKILNFKRDAHTFSDGKKSPEGLYLKKVERGLRISVSSQGNGSNLLSFLESDKGFAQYYRFVLTLDEKIF